VPAVIAATVRSQVATLQQLASRRGLDALIAAMPEPLRQPYRDALGATRDYWAAHSSLPFPELSAEAVPADPAPEPQV